jgi:endonuclease G
MVFIAPVAPTGAATYDGCAVLKHLVLALALLVLPTIGNAAPADCPQQLLDGTPPRLVNEKLAARTQVLCYTGYVALHSGVTRTPLWSAEHLSRARIEAAKGMQRVNNFHPDANVPREERAELSDYSRSGFDRGHMSPSGDMPDAQAQEESFSLANMIPQNPNLNRILWEGIESSVRSLAERDGEVYVVTGPAFEGTSLQQLHGRILVPTSVWKAIYDPKRQQAGAYLAPNTEGGAWRAVSIDELERVTGIDPFPTLPPAAKASVMSLPEPRPHSRRR